MLGEDDMKPLVRSDVRLTCCLCNTFGFNCVPRCVDFNKI